MCGVKTSGFGRITCLLFLFLLAGPVPPGPVFGAKSVTIAVVRDGDSGRLDQRIDGVKKELVNLAGREFSLKFKAAPAFNAGWEKERIAPALESALADPEVDLVYAAGFLVTEAAVAISRNLKKPVIAGVAHDSELMGLAGGKKADLVGKNLVLITIPGSIKKDIDAFRELVPFNELHVLVDGKLAEISKHAAKYVTELAREKKLSIKVVPVGDSAGGVAARLSGARAVYLTPLIRMEEAEIGRVVEGINDLKIPSFSMLGRPAVQRGVLSGRWPAVEARIQRRVALNIYQILLGEAPERLNTRLSLPGRLLLNIETAEKIGYNAPLSAFTGDVEWVGERKKREGARLTLEGAMARAAVHNIDMAVAGDLVHIARGAEDHARSAFLPQVYGTTGYRQIDGDRARSSFGSAPERLTTFEVGLRQTLYDDGIITGYKTAGLRRMAAGDEMASVRLDRMDEAGKRFLNCLAARAIHRIEKDNLAVTEKNLQLARVRRDVGRAGPEELLRWEAEEAQRKGAVIDAAQSVELAFTALNQSLGKRQTERPAAVDIRIKADESYFLDNRFHRRINLLGNMEEFEASAVDLAIENSPEINALEKNIASAKLVLARLGRRYYLPKVTAGASYTRNIDKAGEGVGPAIDIPGLSSPDDNEWAVSLEVTLPFYEGGGRAADIRRATAELNRLVHTRERTRQLIEQRTRSAIFSLSKSWPNIFLTRKAAERAGKNLSLVQDLYARGKATVTDIIDAQNHRLRREQNAALTVYAYLSDLLSFQRAVSWFEWEKDEGERDALLKRLTGGKGNFARETEGS